MKPRFELRCLSVKKTRGNDPDSLGDSAFFYEAEFKPDPGTPENKIFFALSRAATSLNNITLSFVRPDLFEPGKSYFFDIEEVEVSINKKTIVLDKPLQLAKDRPIYETLELYEPTAKQFEQMEKLAVNDPEGAVSVLISMITRLSLEAVKKLEKINRSQWEEARDFLLSFQPEKKPEKKEE
ncbi:MAG: phage tail assembly protein [Smithella sp.]|jgi:hypothetical protein